MDKIYYVLEDVKGNKIRCENKREVSLKTNIKQVHISINIKKRAVVNGYIITKHTEPQVMKQDHLKRAVKFVHQETGEDLVFESRKAAAEAMGLTTGDIFVLLSSRETYKGYEAFDLATHHKKRPKKPVNRGDN
jgi:hypothetical protein